MRFDMWKSKAQKGAFLVLIAVLIPVFLILATLAVDLGKVWAYQSKMQNAVDAAALAGAQNLTNGDQIVDRIDTANHPNADRIAEKYIVANLGNDFLSGDNAPSYQAQKVKINKQSDSGENEEEWAYYRVAISRNIPMTFTKLLGFESFDVKADAVAKIQMTEIAKGDRYFDNLITFSGDMTGSFNNNQWSGRVQSTFDGDIVTIGNYYQKYLDDMHYKFYTPITWMMPLKLAEYQQFAFKNGYRYIKQGNSSEYTSKYSQYDKQIIDAFNSVRNDNKKCKSLDKNEQNINISDQDGIYDYYYIPASNTPNLNISIGKISGAPDKPIYIFVDGQKEQIQINVNEDMTGRPIVFMYLGETKIYPNPWSPGQYYSSGIVKLLSNHKFRGVMYSPYSDVFASIEGEGNDERKGPGTPDFIGSMAAKNLVLQDNNGDFKFEQFALPGSSGNTSQGGESESISGKAELVANRVNPKPSWN